jgi:hypothetical protein
MIHSPQINLDLPQCDVVVVYGEDLQKNYREYQPWLEESEQRYLLLLSEDGDEATERIVSESGKEMISHPQVRVFFLTPSQEEEIYKQIAWEFLFLKFHYVDSLMTKREKEIFSKLTYYQSGIHLLASDYSDLGLKVFANFFQNMTHLDAIKEGFSLYRKFEGIPAIICGAGPSLGENIEQLKKVSQEALIFAGGTALNLLSKAEIRPHFGAFIDPQFPFDRYLEQSQFDLPIFFQSRSSHDVLLAHQGPLLWMRGNGGLSIEDWLMDHLHISTPAFDGGWCVGSFCLALAYVLGCDPIILVGVDLACSGERVYAKGVEEKIGPQFFPKKNKYGKEVMTKTDFLMAADWIEKFVIKHRDRTFLNAGKGGLGFQGIADLSLPEIAEKHFKNREDLFGRVHAEIVKAEPLCKEEYPLKEGLDQILSSLKRCQKICEQMLVKLENTFPHLPENDGEFRLHEVELEEELAFGKIIAAVWNIWKHVLLRNHPHDPNWEFGKYINRLLFYKNVIDSYLKVIE